MFACRLAMPSGVEGMRIDFLLGTCERVSFSACFFLVIGIAYFRG